MDKAEKETQDFMNVESFSQLPFIRPAPREKGIRLFGIEFGGGDAAAASDESGSAETNPCEISKDHDNGESSRRFECHYCCRNFPTSQALGGHQNAHKRERQHAKRAHLQSAMAHGGISEGHVYGYVNYRLGSAPPPPPMTYPSWNTSISGSTGARFYTTSHQQPINGSPLGLWRFPRPAHTTPTFARHPLPLLDDSKPPLAAGTSAASGGAQARYLCESNTTVQDHVSLDLHL